MKSIFCLFFNALMGVIIASTIGIDPVYGAVGSVVGSGVMTVVMPTGVAAVGLYGELFSGEVIKRLRTGDVAPWYDRIPDYSAMADKDVIHMADVGGEVEVLINNTTYPIPVQDFEDGDVAIGLDKFQTKATRITDDDTHNLSYDKIGVYTQEHAASIKVNKYKKAIHALAPYCKTDKMPVIPTTGKVVDGYKIITRADIVSLKAAFDKLEIPDDGRILVLCTDHYNQLLLDEQKFPDQFYNYEKGKLINLYGFEIYTFVNCPYFSNAGVKKGLKDSVDSTDRKASVAFYYPRCFKADGDTKAYMSLAAQSPLTQENLLNFRHYSICLPKKVEAIGAIYSYDGSTTQATNQTAPSSKRWSEVRDGLSADVTSLEFTKDGGSKDIKLTCTRKFSYEVTGTGYTVAKDGNKLTVTSAANASKSADVTGKVTVKLTNDESKKVEINLKTAKDSE